MTREEFEELICDKLGMWLSPSIESLAEELERLFKSSLSLPPAEGAELDHQHDHLLDHPEGAEEILRSIFKDIWGATPPPDIFDNPDYTVSFMDVKIVAEKFATLHAQRLAEKMVEENLVEFGNMIRDEPNGDIAALAEYFIRTINLKTREK